MCVRTPKQQKHLSVAIGSRHVALHWYNVGHKTLPCVTSLVTSIECQRIFFLFLLCRFYYLQN